MTPHDDSFDPEGSLDTILRAWGEPPADDGEHALAELLARVMTRGSDSRLRPDEDPVASELLEVCRWFDELIDTVLECSGVFADLSLSDDPKGMAITGLRLAVSRLVGGEVVPVASTQTRPCVLRDLRRVPAEPDRVILHTGDRVRIEVICDREGYLTVFNIGPKGGLNLLHPERPEESSVVLPRQPVEIAEVELTPPTGSERLYAIWTATPAPARQLVGLVQRGAILRDMKRVQEELAPLAPESWRAVLLELEHRP